MIGMGLNSAQGARKIRGLAQVMQQFGQTRCDIIPTQVVYYHCERKGDLLLARIRSETSRTVRSKWKPKVEAAVKREVNVAQAGRTIRLRTEAIARAWRFGAYTYIDALWKDVSNGVWGRVLPATAREKAAEVGRQTSARTRANIERLSPVSMAAPIPCYGVRHRERGRRWYDVQKGRQDHGTRTDGDLVEQAPRIEIHIGGSRV
jgi:hypothetical protein